MPVMSGNNGSGARAWRCFLHWCILLYADPIIGYLTFQEVSRPKWIFFISQYLGKSISGEAKNKIKYSSEKLKDFKGPGIRWVRSSKKFNELKKSRKNVQDDRFHYGIFILVGNVLWWPHNHSHGLHPSSQEAPFCFHSSLDYCFIQNILIQMNSQFLAVNSCKPGWPQVVYWVWCGKWLT